MLLLPFETDALYEYAGEQLMRDSEDVDREVLCVPMFKINAWAPQAIMVDGLVAGFVCFDRAQSYLASLYVDPDYRGQGLARKVIEELQPYWLEVMHANILARRLYERLGYVVSPVQLYASRLRYDHTTYPQRNPL